MQKLERDKNILSFILQINNKLFKQYFLSIFREVMSVYNALKRIGKKLQREIFKRLNLLKLHVQRSQSS